jgi:hypothetical protein
MRGVPRRLGRIACMLALLAAISTQSVNAAPSDDSDAGWRGAITRAKHLIVKILDELSVPKP